MNGKERTGMYGTENGIQFRVAQAEHALREHEKFLDELRLAKAHQDGVNQLRDSQIDTLQQQHKQTDSAIDKINDSRSGMLEILNDRMSRIDNTLDTKMDHINESTTKNMDYLSLKFEKNLEGLKDTFTNFKEDLQAQNKTTMITILVAVIGSMMFVIFSRTIPI